MSTWVIKTGSSLLTAYGKGLDNDYIARLVIEISKLTKSGYKVALVTSGAVAEGRIALKHSTEESLGEIRAAASVGQTRVLQAFSRHFNQLDQVIGQILITHDDIEERQRYLNARSTLNTLFDLGAIPIINENDTVSTEQIRFGNNDIIGGLIANLIDADKLIFLTDTDGLYDTDPTINPEATKYDELGCFDKLLDQVAGKSRSGLGQGGMISKVQGARLAAKSGTDSYILSGKDPSILQQLAQGKATGTKLTANHKPIAARMRWLVGRQKIEGAVTLDAGAVKALKIKKTSLLPVGVTGVKGDFERGALVECIDQHQQPVARGLINYNSKQVSKIHGYNSNQISKMLGYPHDHELIHRDNLVLLGSL